MKRFLVSLLMVLLVALACYVFVVNSAPILPPGVQVFEVKDHTCVLAEGVLQCFCPCSSGICQTVSGTPTELVITPTNLVVTPEPTKQKCNSGWGNGNEDCNPGQSTQKPHDEGTPKPKGK